MSDYYMEHEKELHAFVDREIIYCVSMLVSQMQERGQLEEFANEDNYHDLYQGSPSYGDWTCSECGHTWEEEPPASNQEIECPECDTDLPEECFEPTEYCEILEHWIVTDWLADKLAAHGEAICRDFYGLTIWGRSCSGQGIALDGVISEIHQELHAKV